MSGLTLVSADEGIEQHLVSIFRRDQTVRRVWATDWRNSREAVGAICAANPLVIALGSDIADEDAIELLRAVDVQRPDIGVVVFRTAVTADKTLELLKNGAREVLDINASADTETRDAIDRVFALVGERISTSAESPEKARRVIAVLSPKGGTGKTTVATNLAVGMAREMPGQVLLIDLDVQFGDVSSALGLVPEHSLSDAVGNGAVDLTALKVFLTRHESGLAVLSPPDSLAEADSIDADALKKTLASLAEEFPIVILDTAAGIDEFAFVALEFATDLLFVSTTDVPAIRAVAKQVRALDQLSMTEAQRSFLLNRSDAKVGLSQGDIEQTVGMSADFILPSSRLIPLSTNQGTPHLDAGTSDGPAKALRELVDSFIPLSAREHRSRRFFRRNRS